MITKDKLKLGIEVPFNKAGDQLGYPGYDGITKKNYIFSDTLHYNDFGRGRSSIKFYFKDSKGREYEMFATNFSDLVKNEDISKGVTGEWSFVKRGANYGLVKVI